MKQQPLSRQLKVTKKAELMIQSTGRGFDGFNRAQKRPKLHHKWPSPNPARKRILYVFLYGKTRVVYAKIRVEYGHGFGVRTEYVLIRIFWGASRILDFGPK